jgi:hypothetical protein
VVSTKFTDNFAAPARESLAAGVPRTFAAVAGMALASGAMLPVSSWFRSLACLVAFSSYFLMSSSGRDAGSVPWYLLAPFLLLTVCLCLFVKAPAARLALLAWVFTSEFWVERSLGGKRRGRGGVAFVLGVMSMAWAGLAALYGASPPMWFLWCRLSGLAMQAPAAISWLICREAAAVAGLALTAALAAGRVRPGARAARLLTAACLLLTTLHMLQPLAGGIRYARAGEHPRRRRPASIALYSEGLVDWDMPSWHRLGLIRSGLFGLFRASLERHAAARGGTLAEVDSLGPDALSGVGLAVFINPTRFLTQPELECLVDFVAAGGGLLVLGDHTDIGGSRAPLNRVLEFTSIAFNFDSAIGMRPRWAGCLEIRRHPVTTGLMDEVDVQIGTGASLEIAPPATPIVAGRYAFGDRGDYENDGRGANMGNGRHDAGEALGNVVLVAGEEVGSGRVLVFGDTSPFQNGAHFLSQRLVSNSVHWLCCEDGDGIDGEVPAIRPCERVAAIDFGRCPRASRDLFTEKSLGGLANCLYRAGVTPVPVYDSVIEEAAFTFLIAPTRGLSPGTTCRLLDYVQSGGRLIVAKGYTVPEPCGGLLGGVGFEILPIPLGSGDADGSVRHKSAWAVDYGGGPDTVTRAASFGYPTVVTKPVANGSITLISDGEFLLDANLESETEATPENVEFLAALFHDLGKD